MSTYSERQVRMHRATCTAAVLITVAVLVTLTASWGLWLHYNSPAPICLFGEQTTNE